MNGYIYCRVSSKQQSNYTAGHISLDVQEINCKEYAHIQGITIMKVVKEISSARNMKKLRNLKSLIAVIKKTKEPAILLINNVSRFSRNTLEALTLINDLNKRNITVFSVQELINMK